MSHELRTPLNAILGFSDIIAHQSMGPDQTDRYSDYAADIHASGAHLLSLINDMLDVAKIESGRMEIEPRWLDPRDVIGWRWPPDGTARAAQKRQSLTIDIRARYPLVLADERAFRQMLLNLLSNAVKFTPEGGHIVVTCAGRPDGGLEVMRQATRAGHSRGQAGACARAFLPDRQSVRPRGRWHRAGAGAGRRPGAAAWRRHRPGKAFPAAG